MTTTFHVDLHTHRKKVCKKHTPAFTSSVCVERRTGLGEGGWVAGKLFHFYSLLYELTFTTDHTLMSLVIKVE